MVILVLPMLSNRTLNADSNYVIMREVIPQMIRLRPDMLFDILWPSNSSDWHYYADGFFDHPNIRRTPLYIDSNKMRQVASFDARAWQQLLGFKDGYYDVVWNNAPEVGDTIKYFEPRFVPNAQPQVVNFHHYVLHDSLNYPVRRTYEHLMVRQVSAALTVDVNIVNSEHCKAMLLDNAVEYLSDQSVAKLIDSIEMIPYGTLDIGRFDFNDGLAQPRHERFTFAYNHRLQDYKQWRTTFEQFNLLWERHPDAFRVQVHGAIAADRISLVTRYPFVEVVDTPGHDDYLRALSRCHANVIHSVHETFCIAAVESMAFGQVLIAPDAVTFPEITGSADNGYPYLFHSEKESLSMMERALTDEDHRDKWGRVVASHVRKEYNSTATAMRLIELFDRLGTETLVLPTLKRTTEWARLIDRSDVWDINDLRQKAYAAMTDQGTHLAAGQSFPSVKIKRLANELGFADEWGSGGKLTLRRSEVTDGDPGE
jgi:glycosyltransferase involved in cell wall biosynthesis